MNVLSPYIQAFQTVLNHCNTRAILPGWTQKFKEQRKQHKGEMLGGDTEHNKTCTNMRKMADVGKEICDDGTKCSRFLLRLEMTLRKILKN
jgi:hypothetical protein